MYTHPIFQALPDRGQLARAGAWESAWSFVRTAMPSENEVLRYLNGAEEVAFEAFFGDAFFGVRHVARSAMIEQFALGCVQALARSSSGAEFFTLLRQLTPCRALGERLVSAEIGAVNAWRTVDAFRVADPIGAARDSDALWLRLQNAPITRNETHPKAIEFTYEAPLKHWFALPASGAKPPYAISRRLIEEALIAATNANIAVESDASRAVRRSP